MAYATDLYHDLPKLARVKLPSGSEYALIDYNGREMIAPIFDTAVTYNIGDYVVYEDELYICLVQHTGAWDAEHFGIRTVGDELKNLYNTISGGISYIGITTTPLYDECTTSPITIGGSTVYQKLGNMVMMDVTTVSTTLSTPPFNMQKDSYYYIYTNGVGYYVFCIEALTGGTTFEDIFSHSDIVYQNRGSAGTSGSKYLEFVWNGSLWSQLGGASAFGELAFKDYATGTYTRPTGSGTVFDVDITPVTKCMDLTTVKGVSGSTTASKVTAGTAVSVAKAGTAVRYGTADVSATAKTVATRSSTTHKYGTADVGTAIGVGTALSGTTVFNTDAIKSASLTGTTSFNTDAIKSATLGGTTTFATGGITTAVSGDCLQFGTAGTGTVTISTTAASKSSVGISTTPAATASVSLSKTDITPAVAAPASQTFYEIGTTTIYEAVAAPNNQTIVPAVANGTITPYTAADVTVPVAATDATIVAVGTLSANGSGASLVASMNATGVTRTVTVGTTTGTITVK